MGKIKIIGNAVHEYQPDVCLLYFEFSSRNKTSDLASKNTNNQCEKLLSELVDKGFKPETILITEDSVRQLDRYDYQLKSENAPNDYLYEARRQIKLTVPADQRIINNIRDVTERGYKNLSVSIVYALSNEIDLKKDLLKEAVEDSRSQAEYFSKIMGQKIIGIESANISDGSDYEDPVEPEKHYYCKLDAPSARPLSDNLSIEKIKLEAEVNIVWLIDNDEQKL